jgi:N-acetylglucosaminyl-diphospho-decaprenol L-rhamnosyltransferase
MDNLSVDSPAPDRVDAVIVSYNSRSTLRACVEPLCLMAGVKAIVVDNDSHDGSLESISDLPAQAIRSGRNGGFAFGCNIGIRAGSAEYILLINPDSTITSEALDALTGVLDANERVGAVGPLIRDDHGRLQRTQRRFPRLRSTWAQALFLHRLAPKASWADEVVWDPTAYERPASPDWLSGACLLVRRSTLTQIGNLDERFFLYCEDIDLCRRLREAGQDVRFEPKASVQHRGGSSAPRGSTLPIYARSRVRYARKHYRRHAVPLERAGVAFGAATHALAGLGRRGLASGNFAALRAVLTTIPATEA